MVHLKVLLLEGRTLTSIFVSLASWKPTGGSDQEPTVTRPARLRSSPDPTTAERREKPIYSDAPFITKVTWQNYKLIAPWTSFFLDVLTAGCKAVEHSQHPGAPSPARARLRGLRAGSASRGPWAVPSQKGPGRGSPPARREGQGQG